MIVMEERSGTMQVGGGLRAARFRGTVRGCCGAHVIRRVTGRSPESMVEFARHAYFGLAAGKAPVRIWGKHANGLRCEASSFFSVSECLDIISRRSHSHVDILYQIQNPLWCCVLVQIAH